MLEGFRRRVDFNFSRSCSYEARQFIGQKSRQSFFSAPHLHRIVDQFACLPHEKLQRLQIGQAPRTGHDGAVNEGRTLPVAIPPRDDSDEQQILTE
jgi:hypothetical protein